MRASVISARPTLLNGFINLSVAIESYQQSVSIWAVGGQALDV